MTHYGDHKCVECEILTIHSDGVALLWVKPPTASGRGCCYRSLENIALIDSDDNEERDNE
jgi:hypothetical protein